MDGVSSGASNSNPWKPASPPRPPAPTPPPQPQDGAHLSEEALADHEDPSATRAHGGASSLPGWMTPNHALSDLHGIEQTEVSDAQRANNAYHLKGEINSTWAKARPAYTTPVQSADEIGDDGQGLSNPGHELTTRPGHTRPHVPESVASSRESDLEQAAQDQGDASSIAVQQDSSHLASDLQHNQGLIVKGLQGLPFDQRAQQATQLNTLLQASAEGRAFLQQSAVQAGQYKAGSTPQTYGQELGALLHTPSTPDSSNPQAANWSSSTRGHGQEAFLTSLAPTYAALKNNPQAQGFRDAVSGSMTDFVNSQRGDDKVSREDIEHALDNPPPADPESHDQLVAHTAVGEVAPRVLKGTLGTLSGVGASGLATFLGVECTFNAVKQGDPRGIVTATSGTAGGVLETADALGAGESDAGTSLVEGAVADGSKLLSTAGAAGTTDAAAVAADAAEGSLLGPLGLTLSVGSTLLSLSQPYQKSAQQRSDLINNLIFDAPGTLTSGQYQHTGIYDVKNFVGSTPQSEPSASQQVGTFLDMYY